METVWCDKNNDTLMGQLQVLQNKAAKVLLNLIYHQEVLQPRH